MGRKARPNAEPGSQVLYEREYTGEEMEFMLAVDRYKRENRRPFPTWAEVLAVARDLGYRKVAGE